MRVLTIICGLMLLGSRLNADGMLYMVNFGDAAFTNLPGSSSGYTDSTILTPSQTLSGQGPGNRGYTEAYAAYLSFGQLGLSVYGSDFCSANTCGVEFQPDNLLAVSSDGLTIGGVSNGTLRLQYVLEGTLTDFGGNNSNNLAAFSFQLGNNVLGSAQAAGGGGSSFGGSLTPDSSHSNTWDYFASGTVDVAISNGFASIFQELFGHANCSSGQGQSCTESVNFLNTALIGGAVVLDSNGNVVQGATITSGSGHDYTQPLTPAAVPEPASWLLLATVLAAVFAFRHRHSKVNV